MKKELLAKRTFFILSLPFKAVSGIAYIFQHTVLFLHGLLLTSVMCAGLLFFFSPDAETVRHILPQIGDLKDSSLMRFLLPQDLPYEKEVLKQRLIEKGELKQEQALLMLKKHSISPENTSAEEYEKLFSLAYLGLFPDPDNEKAGYYCLDGVLTAKKTDFDHGQSVSTYLYNKILQGADPCKIRK